jgi:uncharacterized protein YjbI with pentapeptide repeats
MMKKLLSVTLILVFLLIGVLGVTMHGSDFQRNYKELFNNVQKLNEYTKAHKVELSGENIVDIDIGGAEFNGALFTKVKWENVVLENSLFVDVVFKNCEFLNTKLNASQFIGCVFENCKIEYTQINRAIFKNGQFIGCDIVNSGMVKWTGDKVAFTGGHILDTPLAQANIGWSFNNTDLDGVRMMMSEGSHQLLIEGGVLSEVDFGKSHFSDVTLRRVKQGEGGVKFNGVNAKSINFEDVEMMRGTGIGSATVGMVRIVGGSMYGPSFLDANIAKVYVRDAYVTRFAIGNMMGQVHVSNSTLHRSGLFDGVIDEFSVSNSNIDEVVGENFKADTVIWDNVTLDGKIDFTNAHIKDFRPTRIKRGPGLQLITTGSNIRL